MASRNPPRVLSARNARAAFASLVLVGKFGCTPDIDRLGAGTTISIGGQNDTGGEAGTESTAGRSPNGVAGESQGGDAGSSEGGGSSNAGGAPVSAAQGLAVMTVPFTKANQAQRYGDVFPTGVDLTDAQFVVRLHAPGAEVGQITFYFTDKGSAARFGATLPLSSCATDWVEVTLDVGARNAETGFDPTGIRQLTIEVLSGPVGPWGPGATVVYLDVIRSTNGLIDDPFNVEAVPPMIISSSATIPGATLGWASSFP